MRTGSSTVAHEQFYPLAPAARTLLRSTTGRYIDSTTARGAGRGASLRADKGSTVLHAHRVPLAGGARAEVTRPAEQLSGGEQPSGQRFAPAGRWRRRCSPPC